MEPEWDIQFSPNTYGFRPNRSTWDAISQVFQILCKQNSAQWVIEGDIKGYFDHVNHAKLLAKLAPEDRVFVRRMLKSSIVDPEMGLVPSTRGTPQGGLLSPLLAVVALHGMEEELRLKAWEMCFGRKIKDILDSNKSAKTSKVIRLLNPVIRGWGNYYSTQVSKKAFAYCDHRINQMLWEWARRRHPNKGAKWVYKRYFPPRGNRHWVLSDKQQTLATMADVRIIRHIKIQGHRSPHRPSDHEYFEDRREQLTLKRLNGFQKSVVRKTNGRCPLCDCKISAEHLRRWQTNGDNNILFVRMIPE